jgi:hypothetical protein
MRRLEFLDYGAVSPETDTASDIKSGGVKLTEPALPGPWRTSAVRADDNSS